MAAPQKDTLRNTLDNQEKLGTQYQDPAGGNGGGVSMNMAANCGGTVNAPALAGCNISGSVNITLGSTMAQQGEVPLNKASDQDKLKEVRGQLKSSLKKEYANISEGISKQGNCKLLNAIFTELYITEGESKGVNQEHEVWQIETTSRDDIFQHTSINGNDILKPLPSQQKAIKTVLTKGIAGIGKSVLVQKFTLDWAEDKHNRDIDFVIFLSFRKLNRLQGESHSLHSLLSYCYSDLEELNSDKIYKKAKILFILDGFDESKLRLFEKSTDIISVMKESTVDTLISSLIRRKLLPSAQIWITSRPAAAGQIPADCIDQVTEVRGFKDQQKEEYFRQRASSEQLANDMITHVKNCRSLYIMCHIPVFCWMVATIFETMPSKNSPKKNVRRSLADESNDSEGVAKMTSLTGTYARFLTCQSKRDKTKFQEVSSRPDEKQIIQNLSRLAFKQLQQGNLVFEAEDLKEFNIDLSKDSLFSTMCTEMMKEEVDPFSPDEDKAFSFIHLSMQEFLAALHVFQAYLNQDKEALSFFFELNPPPEELTLDVLLCAAVDKALESKGGQLDLFLRFLLGIVLESNQGLLKNVLTRKVESGESVARTIKHIKTWRKRNPSAERCMNLFLCLLELEDDSLYAEVQEYLKSEGGLSKSLTPAHCSALAYVLLMSDEVHDEFDLKKYRTSVEGRRRLIPAVKCFRKAMFASCELSVASCESIQMVLQSPNSHLRVLDLSCNPIMDAGVEKLAEGLISSLCKVEELKLTCCGITEKSCKHLSPALQGTCLKVIDLSENELKDAGMVALFTRLKKTRVSIECKEIGRDAESKVERIRLARCAFSKNCCETLASVLTAISNLIELDLSDNDIGDKGLQSLCNGLENAPCRIEVLRLSGCMITEVGCKHLLPLLGKDTNHMKELDLSYNHLGDSTQKSISELAESKLKQINMEHGGEHRIRLGLAKYASNLTLDPNTAHRSLLVSEEDHKVSGQQQLLPYPDNRQRFEHCEQVLGREPLQNRHYWEVDWTRSAVIGVTYAGIFRKGRGDDCRLGFNNKSWTLSCDKAWQTVCHQSKSTELSRPLSCRVGIFLDWPAGSLSFFGVSAAGKAVHLYTFKTKFEEPLYAGFKVNSLSTIKLRTM